MLEKFKLAKSHIERTVAKATTDHWQPYSHLFLKDDSADWVFTTEISALARICKQINIKTADLKKFPYAEHQSIFFASRYELLQSDIWKYTPNRLATAYLHGRPGSGDPTFDDLFKILCSAHPFIHRIQVTHSEMRDIVLNSGIDPHKVFLIPIGIEISAFHLQTPETKKTARLEFGIPESAIVVGSFQKDGVGWGEGNEPKIIKGPDVFLSVIKILKGKIPSLFILLTGPARGYVINGLQELNVPYKHFLFKNYTDVNKAYQALDLYLIASRQEGGPKAVLESMATGIPLVTTHVGQAMDLVKPGENAWMTEVENVDGLVHWAQVAINQNKTERERMIQSARSSAEENSYLAQTPLWRKFMEGFVNNV